MSAELGARSAERRTQTVEPLFARTKSLADALPPKRSCDAIARQLIRSAMSIGANYRAARRARSPAEFCAKLGISEEEADETTYWLELLVDAGLVPAPKLAELRKEVNEITAMIVSSIKTAKRRKEAK